MSSISVEFVRYFMKPKRRSPCPVACALDLIGDKWTLLIYRDLCCGKKLFKEFAASPERIATNILTDRLHRLTSHQLIRRDEATGGYLLTPKGETLRPVLQSLADWGMRHIPGTEMRLKVK